MVITPEENKVYFFASFLNDELSIPVIETWIYTGLDPEDGYIFQDASDETKQYCFPNGINVDVLDRNALSKWFPEMHSTKSASKACEYNIL